MFRMLKEHAQTDHQDEDTVKSGFNGSSFLNQGSELGSAVLQKEDTLHTTMLAQERNPPRITFKIGIDHPNIKHKFIAKDFNTQGVGIDASVRQTKETKTPSALANGATKLIKNFC